MLNLSNPPLAELNLIKEKKRCHLLKKCAKLNRVSPIMETNILQVEKITAYSLKLKNILFKTSILKY